MKIIIFTDSLGRPRPDLDENNKTEYEDVYGYKLKKYFINDDVELLYVDSLDTHDAIYWSQRMVAFKRPDIVIFQFGINDCVPRLFKKRSKSIILNPLFRKLTFNFFLRVLSYFRYPITRIRKKVYTKEKIFKENIRLIKREVKQYSPQIQFCVISILKSNYNNQKSYNYNNNVIRYNKILKDVFNDEYFLEINDFITEKKMINDHLHLNRIGHKILFEKLKCIIEEMKS